jgi:hypothetical protein
MVSLREAAWPLLKPCVAAKRDDHQFTCTEKERGHMTKTHRTLLAAVTTAAMLTLVGTTNANADSRRHVFKPGEVATGDVTFGSDGGGGAPEINGTSLGLGLALAIGGLAILSGRRRTFRA